MQALARGSLAFANLRSTAQKRTQVKSDKAEIEQCFLLWHFMLNNESKAGNDVENLILRIISIFFPKLTPNDSPQTGGKGTIGISGTVCGGPLYCKIGLITEIVPVRQSRLQVKSDRLVMLCKQVEWSAQDPAIRRV
jgi:hypothetical protein